MNNLKLNTGCRLVGGLFANGIQFLLGVIAFLTLVIKWRLEEDIKRRKFKIFMLDGSKQGFSSLIAHLMNMLIAFILSKIITNTDECAWYFLSYSFDTILGVYLSYKMLQKLSSYAETVSIDTLKESGNYGNSLNNKQIAKYWSIQTGAWCIITLLSRIMVGLLLVILSSPLSYLADGIAKVFENHPKTLLVVVMVACPVLMNFSQVWIQDQILKRKSPPNGCLDDQLMDYENLEPVNYPDNIEETSISYVNNSIDL